MVRGSVRQRDKMLGRIETYDLFEAELFGQQMGSEAGAAPQIDCQRTRSLTGVRADKSAGRFVEYAGQQFQPMRREVTVPKQVLGGLICLIAFHRPLALPEGL
jgi:hypothetical protein